MGHVVASHVGWSKPCCGEPCCAQLSCMLCQTKLWRAMLCLLILLRRPKRGPEATRQVDERLCDGILIAMSRAV